MPGFNRDSTGVTDQNVVYADNVDFSGSTAPAPRVTADGQLLIGSSVAPNIRVATLTSTGGTIAITNGHGTINLEASGSTTVEEIIVQAGTSPVVPTGGAITFNGAVVAAGTHPVRTDGTGANTMALEVQTSQAIAATDATKIGLAAFNSASFSVDANGFVSANGTGIGETITGQSGGALSPTAGNWNIFGASTAAGTSPVVTSGSVSTLTVNVQKSQAIAATDATKIGLASFNSAQFTVDANGFVSSTVVGGIVTIDGDAGSVTGSTVTITGGTTGLTTSGAGTTLTLGGTLGVANGGTAANSFNTNGVVISNTTATGALAALSLTDGQVVIGSSIGAPLAATLTQGAGISIVNGHNTVTIAATGFAPAYTNVNHAASPYTVLSTDSYISVDSSGGVVSLLFPNAPTANRTWVVKDRTGSSATNNITITTVGGVVTIDGSTTYVMNSNYESVNLLANSTPTYEVY